MPIRPSHTADWAGGFVRKLPASRRECAAKDARAAPGPMVSTGSTSGDVVRHWWLQSVEPRGPGNYPVLRACLSDPDGAADGFGRRATGATGRGLHAAGESRRRD